MRSFLMGLLVGLFFSFRRQAHYEPYVKRPTVPPQPQKYLH